MKLLLFVVHPFPLSPFNPLSPRLDLNGNSVRGILFAKELAKVYHMHIFENLSDIKDNNKESEKQQNENQKGPGKDNSYHSVKMSKSAICGMNPLKVNHTTRTQC